MLCNNCGGGGQALWCPSSASVSVLQGASSAGRGPRNSPPSLNKMTGIDHDAHLIWHRADRGDIFSSCRQLRLERCRATSKKSPGEVHDEEEEEKTSTPGLPHVLIHQAWRRLQGVGSDVNWCSFRSRTSGGLAWWSHRRFVWLRRAPPLVVISFYNQHMQIRNGQPISHGGAAEYWVAAASKHHRVNSPSDTQGRLRANSVRDTLKPSNFHLHSSRLIGSGVFSARSPGQLFHSLSVQRGN